MTGPGARNAIREAARSARRQGWAPIPIPFKAKNPNHKGWQKLRIAEDEIDDWFPEGSSNLGILLGEPSGGLVDIDLDCAEAIALAPIFLPPTEARFGRPSAPSSHWLYQSVAPIRTTKFKDPTKSDSDERAMLVELRSTGMQTLFPPSTHPSGEVIAWDRDGDPALVSAKSLLTASRRLAAATLVARHWPKEGLRQEAAMALGGGLLGAGWKTDDVSAFLYAIATAAGDEEAEARARTAESTEEAISEGRPVTGWPRYAELVGESVVASVKSWLGVKRSAGAGSGSARQSSYGSTQERESSQATIIVDLVTQTGVDLFHDEEGNPFASFVMGDHLETWPLKSKTVKSLLARLFHRDKGTAPSSQALLDALNVLDGTARFDGPERPVAVRLADVDNILYLDLANANWEVVRIEPGAWTIVKPSEVPVRFRRPHSMKALPTPHRNATLAQLRPLLNVSEESDVLLIVGWLLGCYFPRGPRPVLQLLGEQGSAKSTLARILRQLVDPNKVPLRTKPKEEGDLLICATNGLIVALDNLSEIPSWLSDALCRLATGGGLSKRELYTDSDEVLLEARRPVILTAITEVATASDLLDRCITVTLPPIPPELRKTEAEIELLVHVARPAVLGALLDAAAGALLRLPNTVHDRKPRMADFATWVEAGAASLGWEQGEFLDALEANRRSADAVAIEALPVGLVIVSFMRKRSEEWEGTATDLLSALVAVTRDDIKKAEGWPKRANSFSNQLKRLAPNLRRIGISVTYKRQPGTGQRLINLTKIEELFDRHDRHDRHGEPENEEDETVPPSSHDQQGPSRQSQNQPHSQAQMDMDELHVTTSDDCDDVPPSSSESSPEDERIVQTVTANGAREPNCVVCGLPLGLGQRYICNVCSLLPPNDADKSQEQGAA